MSNSCCQINPQTCRLCWCHHPLWTGLTGQEAEPTECCCLLLAVRISLASVLKKLCVPSCRVLRVKVPVTEVCENKRCWEGCTPADISRRGTATFGSLLRLMSHFLYARCTFKKGADTETKSDKNSTFLNWPEFSTQFPSKCRFVRCHYVSKLYMRTEKWMSSISFPWPHPHSRNRDPFTGFQLMLGLVLVWHLQIARNVWFLVGGPIRDLFSQADVHRFRIYHWGCKW